MLQGVSKQNSHEVMIITTLLHTASSFVISNTYLKPPLNPHTLSSVLHRHNIVVGGVCSEPLRKGDGGGSIEGGGGVTVD